MLKYGMPTNKASIKDKNIATYSAMMLQSNWNDIDVDDRRYLYYNNLDKEKIGEMLNVSKRTVQRNIIALIKTGLIDTIETQDGVAYKFNYKMDGKYFVEVEHEILTELARTSSRVISAYLLMKYHLKDGRKQMTQEFIAKEIGMSTNSTKEIRVIMNILAKLGLVAIYEKEGFTTYKTSGGIVKSRPVKELHYELRTYEEWKFLDENIRQKM